MKWNPASNIQFLSVIITTLFALGTGSAFDVSTYFDPVSHVRTQQIAGPGLGDCCAPWDTLTDADRDTWLLHIQNNDEALRWWGEMGMTKLCVHYKNEDFSRLNSAGISYNVINERWPDRMYQYLEAQGYGRGMRAAFADDPYLIPIRGVNGSWGSNTFEPDPTHLNVPTLAIGPGDGTLQEFWRPKVSFGCWKGWARREFDYWDPVDSTLQFAMPIILRLVCDIDPPPNDTSDRSPVAILRWMRSLDGCGQSGDSSIQVLYPPDTIRMCDFTNSTSQFDTLIRQIDAEDHTYQHGDTTADSMFVYIPNPYTLDYNGTTDYHHDGYWDSHEGRFSITFCDGGGHTFYLYSVEAMDAAYYKMFEAPSAVVAQTEQSIADSFGAALNLSPNMVGWYYDEFGNELINSWIRVNKILQNHSLPPFILNGWNYAEDGINDFLGPLFARATEEGVTLPVLMTEFYPLGGDSTEMPSFRCYHSYAGIWTRKDSNEPYIYTENEQVVGDWGNRRRQYDKINCSLQAALDMSIYGAESWNTVLVGNDLDGNSQIHALPGGVLRQIQYVHQHGSKHWILAQGGGQGPEGWDPDPNYTHSPGIPGYYSLGRDPSPEEIKLIAWLSVAMDTDGLMWYWGMSITAFRGFWQDNNYIVSHDSVDRTRGLLEWGVDENSVDTTIFCNDKYVHRNERYYAAKDVCNKIHRIAPVLEPLEFLGTRASRAFEMPYPNPETGDTLCLGPAKSINGVPTYPKLVNGGFQGYIPNDTGWTAENCNSTYCQLSAWKSPGTTTDDYWFLVVNRRALDNGETNETRKYRIHLTGIMPGEYVVAHTLSGLIAPAIPDTNQGQYSNIHQAFEVVLGPAEAELIHFFSADTSDWVINEPDTIYAPIYLHRNIIVDSMGSLTILPNMEALSHIVQGDTIWDSVATVTFWEGKGLTFRGNDFGSNLQVLGNETTQIRFQPANADKPWAGIKITECSQNDIDFQNVIIQGATTGMLVEGGYDSAGYWVTPFVELNDCVIRDCDVGLSMTSQAHVRVQNSDIVGNHDGVWAINSVLRMDTCRIMENDRRGIYLGPGADGRFVSDSLMGNGTPGIFDMSSIPIGIYNSALAIVDASRADLKCCYIGENHHSGIGCYDATLTMADPGSNSPIWGWNDVIGNNNGRSQITADQSELILENGHNSVYGDTSSPVSWIISSNITGCSRLWTNNFWGSQGTSDTSKIRSHLPLDVTFWPILYSDENCPGTSQEGTENPVTLDFISAKNYVEVSEFSLAKAAFIEVVDATNVCPIGRSAIREIVATDIAAGTSDESVDFFRTLADTSTIRATRIEARLAQAWSQAYSAQLDSSAMLMQDLLDSAATDTERVQILIERMTLDLLQQSADSSDEVTFDELKSVVDSIDYLLLSLHVWTETDIYDTVVMYAPCRVLNDVLVHPGGRLEVKPYPGVRSAEITMENGSMLNADGMNSLMPRGAVIVEGTASCPVIIRSDSGWTPIFSPGGLVEMRHARLFGEGVATEVYGNGHMPIIHIDSCEFSLFTDGLWLWNTDSTSYIRNSEFHDMGEGEYFGTEFGACILLIDNARLTIENCNIHDGEGIGILNYYGSTALVQNTTITDCDNYGILNWEGSNLSMECCALTDNGDTLAELWCTDGLVDLVGSHNEFSDSLGTLLYSADPSYVDLEDGECYFNLRAENGLYLKSGDTTDIWDITLNTWNPATPSDNNFFDFLYPSNPVKWTVDSSLADFITCGEGGSAAAISGGSSFLVIGDREAGSYSLPQTGYEEATRSSNDGQTKTLSKTERVASVAARSRREATLAATKQDLEKQLYRERHHREREQWRQIKELFSSGDQMAIAEATKKFVLDNPASQLVPAALVKLSSFADKNSKESRISEFLRDQEKSFADPATRTLARRLSYVSLAKEGNPHEALSGLEEMMETADTPRDSIQALVSAMGVYFFDNPDRKVQPRHTAVRNDNIKQLTKRIIQLARVMDDPNLAAHHSRVAVPTEYRLYQNYPNPFNPNTEIRFDLPEVTRVELKVFNILGQEVAKLADEVRPAGAYKILWNSKTSAGIPVASGVYVYQLKAGKFTDAKKMILLR